LSRAVSVKSLRFPTPVFSVVGALVVKILQGAHPAQIPIQTPDKMMLAINLTTAKAIALELPRSVLERADRLGY